MLRVATCVVLFSFASAASAQIVYEPVNYQYDAGGTTYYYGGSNPRVHDYAAQPASVAGTWGRVHGLAFGSGDIRSHREVTNEPARVFTDAVGGGLINARLLGFTADDARNEAYANVPRYFAKRDLLASAVRKDGAWHVPAQAPTVTVYKSSGVRIAPREQVMPRPLMIIPKDQPLKRQESDKTLARAD